MSVESITSTDPWVAAPHADRRTPDPLDRAAGHGPAEPVVRTSRASEPAADRAARARAALARAEARTGTASLAPSAPLPAERAAALAAGWPGPAVARPGSPSPTGERGRGYSLLTEERPALPVAPALVPLFPSGLRRGATTVVTGSTWLVLLLVAQACAGGAWAGAVGHPSLGLLAAAQAGVDLARFAVVPAPGRDSAVVVAALLDGLDVVVVGPRTALVPADRQRLAARARDRGAVLLSTVDWPGASTVLTVGRRRWSGLADGEGRLARQELRVRRSGRGASAVPVEVDLVLRPVGGRQGAGALVVERASRTDPRTPTSPADERARVGPGDAVGVESDWRLVG